MCDLSTRRCADKRARVRTASTLLLLQAQGRLHVFFRALRLDTVGCCLLEDLVGAYAVTIGAR